MVKWEDEEKRMAEHRKKINPKIVKNKNVKNVESVESPPFVDDKSIPHSVECPSKDVESVDSFSLNSTLSTNSALSTDSTKLLLLCNTLIEKVLVICCNPNSIENIANITNTNKKTLYNMFNRKVGDTHKGLVSENKVREAEKEGNVTKYITTAEGYKLIQRLIDENNFKNEIEQQSLVKQEELRKYHETIELYLLPVKISDSKYVYLDFIDIIKNCAEYGMNLEDDFVNEIEITKQLIKTDTKRNVDVTIKNVPERLTKSIQSLDFDDFGKLLIVEGMIKSRSDRRPKIVSSQFECFQCGNIKPLLQTEKHFRQPKRCGCKGTFTHMPNKDELVTVQSLELEEFSENLKGVNEPRSLRLLLKNSLCSTNNQKNFNPGMRVKFWGTLKRDWSLDNNRKKSILDQYFEVNGYEVLDQTLEFTVKEKDKQEIEEFIKKKNHFDILAKSFCPHIVGNSEVKKGLLLSAVKGMKIDNHLNRDRIHTLLVSNPGQGKTVMVKKLIEITPYGRFTSGLNSSKAGLTASVVKDEFLGGWRLSAGAVALANNGICVVDEMDKFAEEDKKGLNSVMEEGEVVIDKATVHQKLRANTTIIANCNPTNEKFDDMTERIEQLNLPRSLVDRFDLIFVLENLEDGNPFLKSIEEDYSDCVDDDFLSKFLIMAINNKPVMSKEIMKYVAEISYNLKCGYSNFDFGYRQHNALLRLCFAVAKIHFRKHVVKENVVEARNLFMKSLESLGIHFEGVLI